MRPRNFIFRFKFKKTLKINFIKNQYENQLTGTIPTALGKLSELTILSLSKNQLTGTIPPELGNLSNLSEIDTQSDFWGNIRADEKRHANGVKLTRRLASTLQIEERLFVETKHVGQSAELIIVAYHKTVSKTTAYMRVGESWKAWNGEIAHLEAATQYEHLPQKMEIPIFYGDLSGLLGEFTVYSGYRLETEQSIIFNGNSPLKFSVEK